MKMPNSEFEQRYHCLPTMLSAVTRFVKKTKWKEIPAEQREKIDQYLSDSAGLASMFLKLEK